MFRNLPLIEVIGYIGSVLVAISLMMSSIIRLRIINLIGSSIFSIYGFIIGAVPVGLLNGFIALINVYYLFEMLSTKEYFKVLEVQNDWEYLKYFLNFHEKDIKEFNPGFEFNPNDKWRIIFMLRNSVPAGLICFEYLDESSLFVKLDYVIPGYRDFKTGKYMYRKILKEAKIKKIYTGHGNRKHEQYLRKMGFVKTDLDSKSVYCLQLAQ
ncbi:MAG: hypothetical protein P4L45_12105 [Ignavibacteriaceae bacterium]|nr:hypothetical protein [Ignavibacteriaceae bacterium]